MISKSIDPKMKPQRKKRPFKLINYKTYLKVDYAAGENEELRNQPTRSVWRTKDGGHFDLFGLLNSKIYEI
jgi:hypothetical protein